MTKAYAAPRYDPSDSPQMTSLLQFVWLWQLLLGIAGTSLAMTFWLRPTILDAPLGLRLLLSTIAASVGLACLASVPWLQRRDHRGRVLLLLINYLAFLVTFFYTLHRLGVFLAIDDLADTFGRGLPLLAGVLGGYLVSALGDRYPNDPRRARTLHRLGATIIAISLLLMLLAVGTLNGLLVLLGRMVTDPPALGVAILAAAFGFVTWLLWRERSGVYFNATIGQNEMLNGYLLLSPNLLGFLIFFAGPLLFSLYVSFTEWSAFGDKEWIGLANYAQILGLTTAPLATPTQRASEVLPAAYDELARFGNTVVGASDKLFWLSLRNTFLFSLMIVPLSVIPALGLANILNSKIPGMRFFRAIYFLPSVAAVVGVAVIWNWLYNSTTGFINYGITLAVDALNTFPGVALTDPRLTWLSNSNTALFAIVIMSAWRIVGFNTVLFLAGLQGISQEIYEAAEVDGASGWRKFISITIPLLAPTTFFVVTTTVIQSLQVFDEVFVLMNPPQGPSNSTLTAVLYLYQNGFQRFKLGYASAVAWVIFIVIFLVTAIQFRIQRNADSAY
jgi:ABC-type sugar transport system permease subunit